MMNEQILLFKNEYDWLSNFYPCTIDWNGHKYHSVEHAYVSEKSTEYSWKVKCSDKTITAGQIKRAGRRIPIRENFEFEKVDIMEQLLRIKFEREYLKQKLISTHPSELVEGNFHNDMFWGFCLKTNKGQNILGKLLMKIREEYLTNIPKNKPKNKMSVFNRKLT